MIDIFIKKIRPAISFLPTTAVLEMTYRCNHKCLFCSCPWENPDGDFQKGRELTTEEWKDAIQRISSLGITDLCFTGGDALLRDDLWEIVSFARSLKDQKIVLKNQNLHQRRESLKLYLISNGQNVDLEVLRLCKKYKVQLSLSLPGLRTFPELTSGGSPDKVLASFSKAKSMGLFTFVNIIVTKKNLSELFETISAAFLAGADQLLMNIFLKGGRGLQHAEDLALSHDQIIEALDQAEKVLQKAGRFGSVGTELPKCLLYGKKYERLDVAFQCSAAVGFFVIGPSGYARVCNHSQINLCHYRDIESLKMNPYWQKFAQKDYLPGKCFTCSELGRCDGGCREEAHIMSGKVNSLHELVGNKE